MEIRPAEYPEPREGHQIVVDLRAARHQILMGAERAAGVREHLRRQGGEVGRQVDRLGRIETHLVWALQQLDEAAAALEAAGWTPPPIPHPKPPDADRFPGWREGRNEP